MSMSTAHRGLGTAAPDWGQQACRSSGHVAEFLIVPLPELPQHSTPVGSAVISDQLAAIRGLTHARLRLRATAGTRAFRMPSGDAHWNLASHIGTTTTDDSRPWVRAANDTASALRQGDFDFGTVIAKGSFGTVYRAVRKCKAPSAWRSAPSPWRSVDAGRSQAHADCSCQARSLAQPL